VSFLENSEMTDKETTIFFCACTSASLREKSHSFCVLHNFKYIQEFAQSRGEKKKKERAVLVVLKKEKILNHFYYEHLAVTAIFLKIFFFHQF